MAGITELIRTEEDGSLSFGNYELNTKGKVSDFEHEGDLYKVKTYFEITRLEKNELFSYESVPGTAVTGYREEDGGLSFRVEGIGGTQIILAVPDQEDYEVFCDGEPVENVDRELAGKLVLRLELPRGRKCSVVVRRIQRAS